MTQGLILVAASGLAREVIAAVSLITTDGIVGLLDDNPQLAGTAIKGIPILGTIDDAVKFPDANFVVCAGSGISRCAIVERLLLAGIDRNRYTSVIHRSVDIPTSCQLGVGVVILAQVVMTADVTIGDHVVVMPNVVLTHDATIGDYATLCSGTMLGGGARVGKGAYLGMGSTVRERVEIGKSSVLAMGAALLVDLPASEVWAGVPARPMRSSARRASDGEPHRLETGDAGSTVPPLREGDGRA